MNSNLKNYIKILIVCLLNGVLFSPCNAAKLKKNKELTEQIEQATYEIENAMEAAESSYKKGEMYMNYGFNLALLSMFGLSFCSYRAQTDASTNSSDFAAFSNIVATSLCVMGVAGGGVLMAAGKAVSEDAMENLLGENRKVVQTLEG